MYNWAEVYIPTDVSGAGQWAEMDILYESFGIGGNPMTEGNYWLNVTCNNTIFYRNQVANVTATLHSSSPTDPIDNKRIYFSDVISGNNYGYAYTDVNGSASKLITQPFTIILSNVSGTKLNTFSFELGLKKLLDISTGPESPEIVTNVEL